jgi:hypothetical protein
MSTTANVPVGESDETGSVEWDAANELFTQAGESAPAEETEATPETAPDESATTTPQLKEFRYKGRVLQVAAEDYDVLEDLRRQARGENGKLGSENANLKERLARLEGILEASVTPGAGAKKDEGPRMPPPELALEDFPAWQRQQEEYLEWKLEQKAQAARQEYETRMTEGARQQAEAAEAQQNAHLFYQENSHLDHAAFKRVVAQVWVEHKAELGSLAEEDQRTRLAELADTRIAEIRSTGGRSAKPRLPSLEGSSVAPPKTQAVAPSDRPYSAADFVRAARERMRNGARG